MQDDWQFKLGKVHVMTRVVSGILVLGSSFCLMICVCITDCPPAVGTGVGGNVEDCSVSTSSVHKVEDVEDGV